MDIFAIHKTKSIMQSRYLIFALFAFLPWTMSGQSRAFEIFITPNLSDTNLDLVFADGRFYQEYALDYLMGGDQAFGGGLGFGLLQPISERFSLQFSLHTTTFRYQYDGGISTWNESAVAQSNLSDEDLAERLQGTISHYWGGLNIGLQYRFVNQPALNLYLKPEIEALSFFGYRVRQEMTYRDGSAEREVGQYDPYSEIRGFLPLVGLGIGSYIHVSNSLSLNLEVGYQYGLSPLQINRGDLPPQVIAARIGLAFGKGR
jgi:hypothetical protein